MKPNTFMIIVILMLVALAATACSPSPVAYTGMPVTATSAGGIIVSQQTLGLWVNGSGKSYGAPDIVVLLLGVESEQSTVAGAQRSAADAMDNVIRVLKNNGVAEKDIQTKQYNIQQLTQWDDKQNKIIVLGYKVTNMVSAKLHEISKAGTIIDSIVVAGGDLVRISDISFSVDDPSPYYRTAREKAIQAAIDKAKQMADASGVKLGRMLYIDESTGEVPIVRNTYILKSPYNEAAAPAPTSISGGELEFQATVQIVYELN